ncbi:MAG: protein-L-isoaspartate(D-aspartate) O-methyltransferase [Cytophagales bacterium]|nr:protein-L-isoaspartate(D-aspartate) O-methyltransferase [Cytophagales bacterium]
MKLIDTYKHKGLRKSLCNTLRKKDIKDDGVLRAMEIVPRHLFFEKAFEEKAYKDNAFPIGEGQTISQPYTVAIQTELLEVKKRDKILEIGTGSGYQTCILVELGARVYSIECNRKLHKSANILLNKLNYKVNLFLGDGSLGLPTYAPFEKILVTAGASSIPEPLIEQLKTGGIMVIPVGNKNQQKMLKIKKMINGEIETEEAGIFSFVPLVGEKSWEKP